MKKNLIAGIMCAFMLTVATVPVSAAESTVEPSREDFRVVSVTMLTDGISKASWGTGKLHCTDPLFSKPQGYATTETFAGTAYKVSVQIAVKDENYDFYSSSVQTETNASKAESATITSKTSKCEFTGFHWMQDTESSGWQSAMTSASY